MRQLQEVFSERKYHSNLYVCDGFGHVSDGVGGRWFSMALRCLCHLGVEKMMRPFPPEHLTGGLGSFEPAPEVQRWARSLFIAEDASLANIDHEHLQQADIGFLWTNEPNERRGRMILGTCQQVPPSGDKWSVGRACAQLGEWFGEIPDFLITLYGPAAALMDDASFMALVEHELYHAAQRRDIYGAPMFNKETGAPIWTTRPHDVEQFVGVVRRYGADATGVRALVDAANAGPEISEARVSIACGNCLRLVA